MRSASDLRNKIGLLRVGDTAELAVMRGGESMIIRASVTTPVRKLVQGGQVNPLLDGATFGPATEDTSIKRVEVISVQTGRKAARARLRKGDIITAVNQVAVAGGIRGAGQKQPDAIAAHCDPRGPRPLPRRAVNSPPHRGSPVGFGQP